MALQFVKKTNTLQPVAVQWKPLFLDILWIKLKEGVLLSELRQFPYSLTKQTLNKAIESFEKKNTLTLTHEPENNLFFLAHENLTLYLDSNTMQVLLNHIR